MTGISDLFKALSDATRLRMVKLFLHSDQSLCVCELVDALDLPQYQVSRHLGALKSAGLLHATKQGTWAYHSLVEDTPLTRALWDFLRTVPVDAATEEQVGRDQHALDLRLALRSNGACVVGLSAGSSAAERVVAYNNG